MHQSGQERAHSMQTVQFSSLSAMTPRARGAGSSRSWGYCTVTAGFIIVLNVMPRPPMTPGSLGFFIRSRPPPWRRSLPHRTRNTRSPKRPFAPRVPLASTRSARPSDGHLEDAGQQDVEEADGDEELPGECLQLVLTETRIREAHPEHDEGDGHDLGEQHQRPEEPHHAGVDPPRRWQRPPAEVERGGDGREGERGAELADEEEEEAEAGVLDHVAGDQLALGDGHVERGLGELRLRRDQEEEEADELREDQREADAVPAEDGARALEGHDALQVHGAALDHDADDREQQRQLVRDEL